MIGVFDSGVGGLSILNGVRNLMPEYDYMYIGDQARLPYGSKSQEQVHQYTLEAINVLRAKGCKLILVACHTASNLALRNIQLTYHRELQDYEFKLLGVTVPLVEHASKLTKNNNIGLLATRASCESSLFEDYFISDYPDINLFKKDAQLLVSMIEEGPEFLAETKMVAKKHLSHFQDIDIDTMILGCTHFPIILDEIQSILGEKVSVIDSPRVVAESLQVYLRKHPKIETQLSKNGQIEIYSTNISDYIHKVAKIFNNGQQVSVKKIQLY